MAGWGRTLQQREPHFPFKRVTQALAPDRLDTDVAMLNTLPKLSDSHVYLTCAAGHETRHLGLSEVDFHATEVCLGNILHLVLQNKNKTTLNQA